MADTSYSAIKQNADLTVQQGRKFARKQIQKYRKRRTAEQVETARAVGRICPASERKRKSSPPRLHHATCTRKLCLRRIWMICAVCCSRHISKACPSDCGRYFSRSLFPAHRALPCRKEKLAYRSALRHSAKRR